MKTYSNHSHLAAAILREECTNADRELYGILTERQKEAVGGFAEYLLGLRFYLHSDHTQVKEVWDYLRSNSPLYDIVLTCTSRFITLYTDKEIQELIDNVALSIGAGNWGSDIDEDLSERLATIEGVRANIEVNYWYLVLYLASLYFRSTDSDAGVR